MTKPRTNLSVALYQMGLTQSDLYARLRMGGWKGNQTQLGMIVKGNLIPPKEVLQRIAAIVALPVEDLFRKQLDFLSRTDL